MLGVRLYITVSPAMGQKKISPVSSEATEVGRGPHCADESANTSVLLVLLLVLVHCTVHSVGMPCDTDNGISMKCDVRHVI